MKLIITEYQLERFAERMDSIVNESLFKSKRDNGVDGLSWGEPNYYGEPAGDESMFDWRKCED